MNQTKFQTLIDYYLGWTVVVEKNGWQVILGYMCCGTTGASNSPTGASSLMVASGGVVLAGAQVGRSGDTGSSTGPQLYFEVRHCDEDGNCLVTDPNTASLPGQASLCPWENFSHRPTASCQR